MIGIKFEAPNKRYVDNRFLFKIFNSICSNDCVFEIVYEDIFLYTSGEWVNASTGSNIFNNKIVSKDEFLKTINNHLYILFFEFKMYRQDPLLNKVRTYQDFLNDNSILLLVCEDVSSFFVYCKDETIISKMHSICKDLGLSEISIIHETDIKNEDVISYEYYK